MMGPRAAAATASSKGRVHDAAEAGYKEKWVDVTWMPHTSLSQTSHVCLMIRSAHVSLEELDSDSNHEERKVRVGIYGVGGLALVPISCHTPTALLNERSVLSEEDDHTKEEKTDNFLRPSVARATHDCFWDCSICLPLRWRDLPRDAYLLFDVLSYGGIVVYQATLPLFSKFGKLLTGLQRSELKASVTMNTENHGLFPLQTRDEEVTDPVNSDSVWKASLILNELQRFDEKGPLVSNLAAFGEIPKVPWLDILEKEQAEAILKTASTRKDSVLEMTDGSNTLIVELPTFDIPILHEETFYPVPQHGASGAVSPLDLSLYRKRTELMNEDSFDPMQLVQFLDYENEHDNPVEDKYRTLAHDLLRGLVDPALKPDREQRHRLAAIIDSPSHHPTREEKDLLWRFRFSLVDNRRALTKFLVAVDWSVDSEVVQAAELLEQWRKRSPIEVTDALKLLGKHVAFQTNLVRSYAIDTLQSAPDTELRLYLLQLVQALKYENIEALENGTPARLGKLSNISSKQTQVSSLATFLIDRASKNIELANFLYWYLKVELENPTHGSRYRDVFEALKVQLSDTPFVVSGRNDNKNSGQISATPFKSIVSSVSKLSSTFRASDGQSTERDRSKAGGRNQRTIWEVLVAQDEYISGIMDIQLRCRDSRGKKDQKEALLQTLLSKEGYDKKVNREPVPLPSAPDVLVYGVAHDTVKMFKSALYPALVEFRVEGSNNSKSVEKWGHAPISPKQAEYSTSYQVIVKTGDDLRQDQLIIMMIQLMDGLLKRAALDLCLMPYSVIAISRSSGLLEFVDGSLPISQVLSTHSGSVLQFFQSTSPQSNAKYDIKPEVLSTYIRSCAGYCVITFLLGIGDRHLDNILLRQTGHLFHIDFGFAFGRDPKPLPPVFRLTREMVDGMGGIDSSEYRQFCSLACQAYNALRKSAGLVLNLLSLMSDAGIEDLSNNPVADADGVIAKVEERFMLHLSDDEAERYFLGLINDCLTAIAPRVMDVFHSFAVARR